MSEGSDSGRAELEERVRMLEEANRSLWRTNERLARERLTAQDSAAASIAPKLDSAEAELERIQATVSWRLTAPLRWPKLGLRWVYRRVRPLLRAITLRVMR